MDEPLELDIAPGAFAEEVVQLAVTPDHAAREEHRAPGAVALLVDDDSCSAIGCLGRGDETGQARPGDDEVWHA